MTMKNHWRNNSTKRKEAEELGFRSGLEKSTFDNLQARGVKVEYEERVIRFTPPAKERTYKPDFVLPNGIIVETKGRFVTADRQKHIAIKTQYPALDIRIVFSNAHSRISKTSKTTYAAWCDKQGIKWADKFVPQEWLDEGPEMSVARLAALGQHTLVTSEKERGAL
jgi:hypothetical protein